MSTVDSEPERLQQAAMWWARLSDKHRVASADEVAAWLDWAAEDQANADAFERVRALASGLANADDMAKRRLVAEFAVRPRRSWAARAVALAACMAVLALTGGYAFKRLAMAPTQVSQAQHYATTVGVHRDIALPDGSQVALGADSQLETRFGADQRRLQLQRGEAFFEVARETRSFVVDAGPLQVRALGTAFNVRRTGPRVTVSVTHGRVRIAPAEAAAGAGGAGGAMEAVAGQRVTYDPLQGRFEVSRVEVDRMLGWRNDRLEFIDEPLDLVLADINRYSPRPLRGTEPALARLRFTGTVRPSQLDGWLMALPEILPLRVEAGPDEVVVHAME